MPAELYEFGDVTVDLRRVEVRRGGGVVPLEPKSFDLLCHLLEHRDRLVTKDELLDAVWKDTFVTPNALTRAVAQLRKGLGDDAFEARYIETVAKRGYRFIAPVSVHAREGSPEGEPKARAEGPAAAPRLARRRWVGLLAAALLVAGAGVATRAWLGAERRREGPEGEALLTPRRLTAARESYGHPALSPNGSVVVYTSARTGSREIYVVGLAPGSRELAITSDGRGNTEPRFSPDGQWLAYRSGAPGGIWVVPATGGAPRRVTDFGSQPSWAPDSQTIVFSSRAGLSSQGVLWTVRRDGTGLSQLTWLGNPLGGHGSPAWSPDGRLVAFMVGQHEERAIWAMPAGGGAPWRLASLTRYSQPSFAPDGRAVYFLGTSPEQNDSLMRVALTAAGAPAGEPERVMNFQGAGIDSLSIAQDGRAIYAWSRRSVNLFALELDAAAGGGGERRQLTFDEDVINRYPHFSGDGRIAFEQVVAGRPITAWVMDEDGGNALALSAGLAASARTPQWERGARRVFALIEPGEREPPWFAWIDVATRELSRIPLPSEGSSNMPMLSPDGRQIAYHLVAADGSVDVWVRSLDGGAPRQVTFDREAASYPRWSADGERLVVNVKRGENNQVGVVPATGGPLVLVTSAAGTLWGYAFAPDGERIVFSRDTPGERGSFLHVVSLRTRETKRLTTGRFPAVSPHGNRVVFSDADSIASLWTLRLPTVTP